MVSDCSEFLDRIARAAAGDLSAQEQQELDIHLAACHSCNAEQEKYADTLKMLGCVEDEPAPRHFFVYPPERMFTPWQAFLQLTAPWRVATAGACAVLVLVSVAAMAGMRIQSDQGSWALSFGRSQQAAVIDATALKTDILKTAEEKSRADATAWIRGLRAELGAKSGLSEQQQMQIADALSDLEARLNGRVTAASDEIRAGAGKANLDLYRAVSQQRQQDINGVNSRIDRMAEANETRFQQTEEILDTLLQIVTNLKQTGELK